MAKTRPYDQDCPIARTLDVLGDRWTLLIIRDMFMGMTRFNQFLESSSGMPPKILSNRLKKLVDSGLVERRVYSEHPLRAEYHLSDKGLTLFPVIKAIGRWGFEHMFDGEEELRDRVEEIVVSVVPEFAEP